MNERPGRVCPADYRYPASTFDRPPELAADVLYVVGGLYGNLAALDEVERLAAQDNATIVFNGDFHWFDADAAWFAEIEQRVARRRAIRGNVETEIARSIDIGAGCGCAYPASVTEDVVRRSNEILVDLRQTAFAVPGATARLAALPMHLVAEVGGIRVGIVHGDANGLAGWSFAHDALDDPAAAAALDRVQRSARIDAFASTHTCLAVLRDFELRAGRLTIVNNGAAGMPNFSGSRFGLISRIATRPSPIARSTASSATACTSMRSRWRTTTMPSFPVSSPAGPRVQRRMHRTPNASPPDPSTQSRRRVRRASQGP